MEENTPAFYFKKLNALAYNSMNEATELCIERTHAELDLAHWLHVIASRADSDFARIIGFFSMKPAKLASDLVRTLDGLPRGASRVSSFSRPLVDAMEQAWIACSLLFGQEKIRTGHLLVGIVRTPALRTYVNGLSAEFRKINIDDLTARFGSIVAGSVEDASGSGAQSGETPEAAEAEAAPESGRAEDKTALQRFTVDLTARAKAGEIDPVYCRDDEIRQVIDILMRRRQNNPILTGEAGVGKTAVVEGLAIRISEGLVPPPLQGVALRTLDIGLLQAGASMKGEFEDRLRKLIEEVQSSPTPIILFIDEAHTLIGAGGEAGVGDAANLLKPALARGTLRTIGATTWGEYKKHIEKDPALTRRFQVVKVDEPTEESAIIMLTGVVPVLEKHHGVLIRQEAVESAVRLSHRYIPARQLPDKAVSLLDTACARVALSQGGVPAEVERCRETIRHLELETELLNREIAQGVSKEAELAKVQERLAAQKKELETLEARWKEEKELVAVIIDLRSQLDPKAKTPAADPAQLRTQLNETQDKLAKLQGETPLIHPTVDESAVAVVVAGWTGIPVGRMVRNEIQSVLSLGATLGERVIGQQHALDAIARRIITSRAGLDNPNKPVGVFMLVGSSGVGKTETALALAETLYGGETNLITINMSEFQEAHTVSTLKGAPPGYVGYGEGGVLTEAVRRRPYSVVLLDEVEKAHPDVHEIFFQAFDKGFMEDGEGRFIDFKNTIILLTSNVGSELLIDLCKDPELLPGPEALAESLRPALLKTFPAAFLGRTVIVPYFPLSDTVLAGIVRLQLDRIKKRMALQRKIDFSYGDPVVNLILSRCKEVESGGRTVDRILTGTLLPEMSEVILTRLMHGNPVTKVKVSVKDGAFGYGFE
jgi:type VI secretion system protein VasG